MHYCDSLNLAHLNRLLEKYGMEVQSVEASQSIPGSFWGESEAGLRGTTLYVREDTPVHSALHEACHYICMDKDRRQQLDTDAGGDYEEENGVCYLQILLAEHIPGITRQDMWTDMDEWGYSFRLGSARAWFESDAEDARLWLARHELIDSSDQVTWQLREF